MIDFENLDKAIFPGVGKYGIPEIAPTTEYPVGEFLPIHQHYKAHGKGDKILHCFDHDYFLGRYWNQPDRYIKALAQFKAICSPDFSMYTDMPLAMQIYNHYRKHWLAAYWQAHGLTVYPTIGWSDERSYDWCFDGEPKGGIVAVSSVGTQRNKEAMRLFLRGYDEMMKRLDPQFVIFCGKVPIECDWNVIRINPNYSQNEKIREAEKQKATENSTI